MKKINEKISEGYAYIFDRIEKESLKEIITDTRSLILKRIFKRNEENLENFKKQKSEEENEYKESVKREILAFIPFYNKAEKLTPDTNEKIKYIDAKFYELFFKAVDDNQDNKRIFKFIIEELNSSFKLMPEKVIEYKAFVIDYFLQREKVSLFYELFVKEDESFYKRLFGKKLSEISGFEINKGKLSLEVFMPEQISNYMSKYFGILPNLGMATTGTPLYLLWAKYIKNNVLKNQRAGTFSEILVVNRDKNEGGEWDTYSIYTQYVLRHERKHIEFAFKNLSKNFIKEQEIDQELRTEIKEGEGDMGRLADICIKFLLEDIKNECLATASGSPITRFNNSETNEDEDIEIIFRVSRADVQEEISKQNKVFVQSPTFDGSLIEDYKFFIRNEIYAKRKKQIIKLGRNREEREQIEKVFKQKEKELLVSISYAGDRLDKFIAKYPHEKHYLLNYLEMFPVTEWKQIIERFDAYF